LGLSNNPAHRDLPEASLSCAPDAEVIANTKGACGPPPILKLANPCDSLGMDKTLRLVVIVILILLLIGSLPAWPYSMGWGYYPSGGLGTVLLVLIILLLLGKI
jgi:hypothetical protein